MKVSARSKSNWKFGNDWFLIERVDARSTRRNGFSELRGELTIISGPTGMSCGCRPPTLTGASTLSVSFTFSTVVYTRNLFKTAFYPSDINLYIVSCKCFFIVVYGKTNDNKNRMKMNVYTPVEFLRIS